jgi:cation diffusion facilitator CzcD-associated flavoprotein CzcO
VYIYLLAGVFECINMVAGKIRRVAVIGAGPSGAITVDALVREEAFDQIRVFDRQEGPGGCW